MTTFQDPPSQSRRAIRQSERGESVDPTVAPTQFSEQRQPTSQQYADPFAPRDIWDTIARRAAQPLQVEPNRESPAASGRRSSGAPGRPADEPLTYTTQARPAMPSYDGPSFRNQIQHPPVKVESNPVPQEQADQATYRVRDFSPDGRRDATPVPALAAELVIEHTMTRRELRALQAEEAAATPEFQLPEVVEAILHSGAIELPVSEAVSEVVAAPMSTPVLAPPSGTSAARTGAMAEFDALTRGSQATEPEMEEPATWAPPASHWSMQTAGDDETQPREGTINRTIGSSNTAADALVLPSMPQPSDVTGAMTSTGEIMFTGSIDLPRSLGSTGATTLFDGGGIDALFEASDYEIASTDSAPVRAIRAVSTHNSTGHGVTHTRKPTGDRMLTVLIISASALAIVAAGLFVVAMAFNVF